MFTTEKKIVGRSCIEHQPAERPVRIRTMATAAWALGASERLPPAEIDIRNRSALSMSSKLAVR